MPPKKPADPNAPAKPKAPRPQKPAAGIAGPLPDPLRLVVSRPEPASPPQNAGPPPISSVDIELFSRNVARIVEEGGKSLAAYM